jgi:hypothetical protein
LKKEIEQMREDHRIDMDEQKLQYELRISDLDLNVKRQSERLKVLEQNVEFEDILKTYNN